MTTFWERVESALKSNHITEAELSRRIGFTQAGINGWKTRDAIPRADIAIKTAEVLNTTVEYLVTWNHSKTIINKPKNTFLVPILNQELSAGKGEILPEDDFIKALIALPSFLREYGNDIAGLYVHGDSMEQTLKNGDLVICSSRGWDNAEGLYAIRLNGNGYVKRIQVGAGKIIIRSDNPKYSPIEEPIESEAFSIIGKVLLIVKKSE